MDAPINPNKVLSTQDFQEAVETSFGRNFNPDSAYNRQRMSQVAQKAFEVLKECKDNTQASPLEKIDVLENLEEGLTTVITKVANAKGWAGIIQSKSPEELEAINCRNEIHGKLEMERKKEFHLWNGDGILRTILGTLVPNYMEKFIVEFTSMVLQSKEIQLRLAAARLMGHEEFKGKQLAGMPPICALFAIVEDLNELKKKFGYLLASSGDKLNDLLSNLESSKELVTRFEFIRKLKKGLATLSFDAPEHTELHNEERMQDVIYTFRRNAKKLKPGQEILIPGGAHSSLMGGHALQFAIGKDEKGTFHFRIIDTGATHINQEELGLKDIFNIGRILLTGKMNDLGFKDLTIEQATDPAIWKILMKYYLGEFKTSDLKEIYNPICHHFVNACHSQPTAMRRHEIQHNATSSESSVMAWIETSADPILFQLVDLHRILSGFQKLEALENSGWNELEIVHNGMTLFGKEAFKALKEAGKKQFEEKYSRLKKVLGKPFNEKDNNDEMHKLADANEKIVRELNTCGTLIDPVYQAKLLEECEEARVAYCVETKQNSKKEVKSPSTSMIPDILRTEVQLWKAYQKKKADYEIASSVQYKKETRARIAALKEDIVANAQKQKDLTKGKYYHVEYGSLLEHLYNNFPFRDLSKIKVEFEDFIPLEDSQKKS